MNKYFKSASWLYAEKIFRLITSVFISIWIARYLGPQDFGLLNYAHSLVGIFSALTLLGFEMTLVREIVYHPKIQNELLFSAFVARIIGSSVTLLIITLIMLWASSKEGEAITVIIIASANIFQAFTVIDSYFQANVVGKYTAIAYAISFSITSLAKIYLMLQHAPLLGLAFVFLADGVILASLLTYFYIKSNPSFFQIKTRYISRILSSVLKRALPLIVTGVVVSFYTKIDQIMIKNLLGNYEAGAYSAAVTLCQATYFLPMVLSNVLFPAIINSKKFNIEQYKLRLQVLFAVLVWVAIGIAVFLSLASDLIITSLYGPEYAESSGVLAIYAWAGIAVFYGTAWSKLMIVENLHSTILKINVLAMLTNVGLNYFLIPMYGITGAAIATVISYSAGHSIFALIFKNQKDALHFLYNSLNLLRLSKIRRKDLL
jgi:O-antigen/teichoic acid export membrane protein